MSDFTQIVAISALGLSGAFFIFYFSKLTNEVANQIVTGFIDDHHIPPTQRWLMLYTNWVSCVIGGVTTVLFLAFAELAIADHVGHADSKLLACLLAFLLSIASCTWLIVGSVHFMSYRLLLRQAEAD